MSNMPPSTYSKISDLVQSIPIDIDKVAKRLGLAVFKTKLPSGISGALWKEPSYETESGFVIFVNENEAFVRQRFTAAHEIGHFVLHRKHVGDGIHDNYLLRSDGFSNWMESEANMFAADLLMPFELLNKVLSGGEPKTVSQLAEQFEVSKIAMGIRLGHPT